MSYPYWSEMEGEDGRKIALYWCGNVKIAASIILDQGGTFKIHYLDGDTDKDDWTVAIAVVDNMDEAKLVAEAIMKFLPKEKVK